MTSEPPAFRVTDHTDPEFARRNSGLGRTNGGVTYSREIVAHHVPIWREHLAGLDAAVGTAGLMAGGSGDVAVQYLHTYGYDDPLEVASEAVRGLSPGYRRVVLVTAYLPLHTLLTRSGYLSVHLPMTVDADEVRRHAAPEPRHDGKRALYFGNVLQAKAALHKRLRSEFAAAGWTLDTLSCDRLNTRRPTLTQAQAWGVASRYRYGVGVGRCALELLALGVHTMVGGMEFGGIVTDSHEYRAQSDVNFNGRVVTFDRNIRACIEAFDLAASGTTNDLHLARRAVADAAAWVASISRRS